MPCATPGFMPSQRRRIIACCSATNCWATADSTQGRDPRLTLPPKKLAGPALSLPSIAVVYAVMGFKKTAASIILAVVMSTFVGMAFGWLFV